MSNDLSEGHDSLPALRKALGMHDTDPFNDTCVAKILFLITKTDQPSSPSLETIIENYEEALRTNDMLSLRSAVYSRLSEIKEWIPDYGHATSVLEKNFLNEIDVKLLDVEDIILLFNDIFMMFSITAPSFFKEKFDSIIKTNEIPVPNIAKDIEFKPFFIYAENKVLSEICDLLKPADVFLMFSIIKSYDEISLNITSISEDKLHKVPGLKDVAYYFLILNLIKKQQLNRLHTCELEQLLKEVKKTSKGKENIFNKTIAKLERYPISSRPQGLCIIFSMNSTGIDNKRDKERVKDLFENVYKFDILDRPNLTAKQIHKAAEELSKQRHKFYDSLVVWFMGQGSRNSLFVSKKEEDVTYEIDLKKEFITPFSEIEWLNKKPKLFFIHTTENLKAESNNMSQRNDEFEAESDAALVRGTLASLGWQKTYSAHQDTKVNNFADTLIAFALGICESTSKTENGSYYVKTLIDQLRNNDQDNNIEIVLQKIHYFCNIEKEKEKANRQELFYYESSLQKEFVFQK